MKKHQYLIIVLLAIGMGVIAAGLGSWAEQVKPDGIVEHTEVTTELPVTARNSYYFGMSMGLLAAGLLYCCIAFALLIYSKTKGRTPGAFVYSVAALAVIGFVLSYLVDDYFY